MNQQENNIPFQPNSNTLTLAQIIPSCFDIISSIISTCHFCSQRFNKKSHLYRHIREKHEQVRSYVCTYPECGKKFKRDSHLKRHYISHTHQKNFKCGKCIMQFGYKHHLQRHIRLIHEKVLYKCTECQAQFLKKKSLSKHFKEHTEGKNLKAGKRNRRIKKSEKTRQRHSVKEEFSQVSQERSQKNNKNQASELEFDSLSDKSIKGSKQEKGIHEQFYQERDFAQHNNEEELNEIKTFEVINRNQQKVTLQNSIAEVLEGQKTEKKPQRQMDREMVFFRCRYNNCLNAYKSIRSLRQHIDKKHKDASE